MDIPNDWEIQYFGSTTACHPHVNSDGDGQTNYEEWIGGSDPTDPRSTFAISSIALAENGGTVLFHWPTLPDRRYDLYCSTNCAKPWQTLAKSFRSPKTPTRTQSRYRAALAGFEQRQSKP